jgi:ribosome-associated translation inhibitor RaiA
MKLEFRGDKSLVTQAQRAERRIALVLGRFGNEVHSVTLRLSKTADHGGLPSKRCEIVLEIKPKRVRVEHTDTDLTIALDRAADKAARAIARAFEGGRSPPGPERKRPI